MRRSGEESLEGVVAGNHESGNVGEKLTAKVEDDEEEVEEGSAEDSIGLRDTALSLEVDKSRVSAQLKVHSMSALARLQGSGICAASSRWAYLFVELANIVLNLFLRGRHRFVKGWGCLGEVILGSLKCQSWEKVGFGSRPTVYTALKAGKGG
jgi:hypothetical protein